MNDYAACIDNNNDPLIDTTPAEVDKFATVPQ